MYYFMFVDEGKCGYLLDRLWGEDSGRGEEPLTGRWADRDEDEDDEGDAQTSDRCLTGHLHLRLNTHFLDIAWYFFFHSNEHRRKVLLLVLRSRAGCENGAAWINSAQGRSGLIWALFCDCETSPFGLNEIPLYLHFPPRLFRDIEDVFCWEQRGATQELTLLQYAHWSIGAVDIWKKIIWIMDSGKEKALPTSKEGLKQIAGKALGNLYR